MDTRSPILRWREIVHPLFWPVFFWNLRRFARKLQANIAAKGNGLIDYEITWWGGIRIWRTINPDAPGWDVALEGCSQRVHLATLDVGNPFLSNRPPLCLLEETSEVTESGLSRLTAHTVRALHAVTLDLSAAGKRRRARLALGCFAEPAHLNTS
ncbi:MAG: hypothetical protein AAFQ22_00630 [Pseudomonadota bacterium]